MDCCELAVYNGKLALYIALGAFAFLTLFFFMFFGYSLYWDKKTGKLTKRTIKLEKKNGHEQHQIDELKQEIASLKSNVKVSIFYSSVTILLKKPCFSISAKKLNIRPYPKY